MARGKHEKHAHKKEAPEWQQKVTTVAKSKYVLIALLLAVMFFAVYFRAYPASLPITKTWAQGTLENQYVQQATTQLQQQFPHLPPAQLQQRAQQLYQQQVAQNPQQIQQQVDTLAAQFKSRLQMPVVTPSGKTVQQTYFLAIDPYYWLRRVRNIYAHGNVCDATINGTCMDTHMLAPNGVPTQNDFHSFVEAAIGKIGSFFGFAPISAMFFLPAIFAAIAAIPAFFIIDRRYGSFAAAVGALVIVIHPVLLGRTPAGFVDTDIWNALFPLMLAWLFLIGLDRKDKWGYAYMAGAAVFTGLYAKFWSGWYFAFIIVLLTLIGSAVYAVIRMLIAQRTERLSAEHAKAAKDYAKRSLIHLGVFIVVTGIVVTLLADFKTFIQAFYAPLQASIGIQAPVNPDLWPNVLTTVAELNTVPLGTIIGELGGRLIFILSVLGTFTYVLRLKSLGWKRWAAAVGVIAYYLLLTTTTALNMSLFLYFVLFMLPLVLTYAYSIFSEETVTIHYGLLVMGWFAASMFATTQGTRFLLLIIPFFGIAIGFAVGWLLKVLPPLAEKEIQIPRFWGAIVTMALVFAFIFTPVSANLIGTAHSTGINEVPSMNDAWWTALKTIEADSQPNAIITSWWDFGHWFKYVANRSVTFDGASQTTHQAHWVGLILQTNNDTKAVGILRMLDCGGNDAYARVLAVEKDPLKAYNVTDSLLGVSKQTAEQRLLADGFTQAQAQGVLAKTHCDPPEAYLITSSDMVGKAAVWGHFGLWNFDKAYVANAADNDNRQTAIDNISHELNVSTAEATQLYTQAKTQPTRAALNAWVSPWPSFAGASTCTPHNGTENCGLGLQVGTQAGQKIIANQLIVNTTSPMNSSILLTANGQYVGVVKPGVLYYNGTRYDLGGQLSLSVDVENDTVIIADDSLVHSMFAQLFYRHDSGPFFHEVTTQRQVTGGSIIVWKVNWGAYINATR